MHFSWMATIIEVMKSILFLLFLAPLTLYASVVGVSNHQLSSDAKVVSLGTTGFMNLRHEMGLNLRYTQELHPGSVIDFTANGSQYSRHYMIGGGMDVEIVSESDSRPRFSLKPFYQYQRMDTENAAVMGAAPILKKGLNIQGQDFFPYLALPSGIKIDGHTDAFVYYASLSLGASMPLPQAGGDKLFVSVETNKNMGAANDYVSALISWIWM